MAIITVGKGQQYSSLYYAAPHVKDGDTVELFSGVTTGAWIWAPNVTIKGMEPGIVLSGPLTQGKGLLVLSGANVTVENITFSGANNYAHNGAGINFSGTNLTVLNSTFLNNEDGILTTPNKASTITVKNSTFDGNGSDAGTQGAAHGIYAGAAALLDVEDSTFTNTKGGHSIKSRADNTIIKNNSITDGPTGTSSYLIDIPNGGAATITGNTLEKGPLSSNYNYAITMGEEGVKNPTGPVLIANNTYVNDDRAGVFAHNQTGSADFVVINNTISGLPTTVLTGLGTTIDPSLPPPNIKARAYSRDFDGDGKDDVLVMSCSGSSVQVGLLNGTANLTSAQIGGPAANGWKAVLTGDFNSDGKADIVWQNTTTQDFAIYLMNGTSKAVNDGSSVAPGAGWNIVGSDDFDGDKRSDLILQNGSQVELWLMNGTSGTNNGVLSAPAPSGFAVIATGDFNGDGSPDILWQNSSTSEMQVWMMNGTNFASSASLANPGANWHAVDTGDFDGDGHTDILLQNTSNGQCAVWLMNGTTQVGGGNLASNLGTGWKAISAGDYNGDGQSDILFRNPSSGALTEVMMSGSSILSSGVSGFSPGTTFYAVAG